MSKPPFAVDSLSFRRACSKFATGVSIATLIAPDGAAHGMTVNSFTSVSCCPPVVLVCIDHRTGILQSFRSAIHFGINVLSQEQRELSIRFAQRGQDRFEGIPWLAGYTGVPMVEGALAFFECRITDRVIVADHDIILGEVVSTVCREGHPLIFFNSGYGGLA